MEIITGVTTNNNSIGLEDVTEWSDLVFLKSKEDHAANCEHEDCYTQGHTPWIEATDEDAYYAECPIRLYGFKLSRNQDKCFYWFPNLGYGLKIDEKADYSAIRDEEDGYTQIVKSKYVSFCHKCSPCFPNQGDLSTHGLLVAYTLPPELLDEEYNLPIIPVDMLVEIHYYHFDTPMTSKADEVYSSTLVELIEGEEIAKLGMDQLRLMVECLTEKEIGLFVHRDATGYLTIMTKENK